MAYKITFSGLDGAGKSTSIDKVSRKLANDGYNTIHVTRPFFADIPNKSREFFCKEISEVVDYLHKWGDINDRRTLVGLINVVYQAGRPAIEKYGIKKYEPDIILAGRDSFLDPCAYSLYYFPFTRKLKPSLRIKLASFITQATESDLLFYMDIDPNLAYERIRKRAEENGRQVLREKWGHMHENLDDLKFLKDGFEESLDFLVKQNSVKIIMVDASKPQNDIVNEILLIIESGLK